MTDEEKIAVKLACILSSSDTLENLDIIAKSLNTNPEFMSLSDMWKGYVRMTYHSTVDYLKRPKDKPIELKEKYNARD